ncbi:serine/threonine protein kinase [Marivivens marinus]|uniref:serine/threonine protein kinase n=1 Tax=Marivivens marinus TaxID=3110173 RepID=UPI003B8477B4
MSFLPYGRGSFSGWTLAYIASGAVHAAAVAGFMGAFADAFTKEEQAQDVSFVVTLERLDADTLAGIVEQEGLAGAEGEVEDGTDPESLEPEEVAAATEEPVEPEVPETPEETPAEELTPETPEELVAETPEALEPETIAAAPVEEPEAPAPLEPEVLAPEPVAPEPVIAEPVQLDDPDLNPILPETIAASPVIAERETISAAAPPAAPIAPTPGPEPEVIAAAPSAATETVTAISSAPVSPPASEQPRPVRTAAPPSEQDLAIGDLIRRIRAALTDPCLIALPRRDGPDGVGIAMISARDGAMEDFAQGVLTAEDSDIRQTRTLVDPRQCSALTYVRQNVDYPATRMGLRIDNLEIASGGRLTGVLRGGSGRYITLLLVDDNGVVQDLQRFMTFSGNLARFDVPVTRSGPPRDTSQILIALGTVRPPTQIRERNGQLAEDVFEGLSGDLADGAYLAISTFDVR